uniref:EB domain-containing protein n=1 Tax=Ditylenchus dipsaci TaxID=166011 RepID=A0A915E256_9BILA
MSRNSITVIFLLLCAVRIAVGGKCSDNGQCNYPDSVCEFGKCTCHISMDCFGSEVCSMGRCRELGGGSATTKPKTRKCYKDRDRLRAKMQTQQMCILYKEKLDKRNSSDVEFMDISMISDSSLGI